MYEHVAQIAPKQYATQHCPHFCTPSHVLPIDPIPLAVPGHGTELSVRALQIPKSSNSRYDARITRDNANVLEVTTSYLATTPNTT